MRKPTPRDRYLLLLFSIVGDEYEVVKAYQQGVCFICKKPPKKLPLAVDHRHSDGLVRGLLCMTCNKAVAYLADNAERAQRMLTYLTHCPVEQALGRKVFGRPGRVVRKWRTKRERNERLAWCKARLKELGYDAGR